MNTVVQILDTIADEAARADHSDEQLLDLFVRLRDNEAFANVVRRYGPMVLGVCRRVLRNPADADDAFQAAFLVLARKAATIGTRHLLGQWLYGVAYNTARKLREANTRRAVRERPLADAPEPHANATDARDELLALLDDEVSRLPERYRAVIVLCDLEGRTRREAANALACPEGTVAGRLARARSMLAARLIARGAVPTVGLLAAVLSERVATALPPMTLAGMVRAVSVDSLASAAANGLISQRVADTTEGVLRTMFTNKLRAVVSVVLCCGMALACGFGAIHFANAQPTPQPKGAADPLAGDKAAPEKAPAKPTPADAEKKLLCVIPLKKLDAKTTAEKLAKLLPAAVTVAAVRDENGLIIYATAKGTDDVRLVLRTLGEELPKEDPKPAVKKYTFRMKNVPWADVLKWYSEESRLTMITTVKPTGTFTFDPPEGKQFTLAEITDILNEALEQQKFILIPRHMTFFIHPADEKIDGALPPRVSLEDLPKRGRTELVQVILPVRNLDILDAKDELKKLLTPFGTIIAVKNALVIQDTAGNIIRIQMILEEADKASEPKANPLDPRNPQAKPKLLDIRLKDAPWKDVMKWYAEATGLTANYTVLPKGTFTCPPSKPGTGYTFTELTDLINDALLAEKFLLVRRGKEFTVVPADEKIDPKYITHVELHDLDKHGRTEFVTVHITLPAALGPEIEKTVRKLIGPFGKGAWYPPANTLILSDTVENVRTIVTTASALEKAGSANKPSEK